MALLSWDDEENKKDELFQGSTVASVQSGAWQPSPSGANAPAVAEEDQQDGGIFNQKPKTTATVEDPGSYLVSDTKAAVDQRRAAQRDAEIEAARQAAAQRAAATAAQKAAEFREGRVQDNKGQTLNVDELKKDQGWKKYYDAEFKREKDGLDFWGRLMDGGGASRRAEAMARNRYNMELVNKAYDANGNVMDEGAAVQAKKLAAYNAALANDNSARTRAAGEAIGAFDTKPNSNFWNRVKNSANAVRQMSAFDALAGVDDKNNTGVNDAFRFGGNVIQGVFTAPIVGSKAGYEAVRGRGTDYATGLERNLDLGERGGRGVSGAIDLVGTFLGGSGKLVESLGANVVKGTATQAEKTLLKKLTSDYIIPSLVEGGEAGAQAAAEYFGNDGTLLDENGEIDVEKVAEMLTQTAEGAAMGVAAGGVFTGTAAGVNRFRNRGGGSNAGDIPSVDDANINFEPKIGEANYGEVTPFKPDISLAESSIIDQARRLEDTPRIPQENISYSGIDFTPAGKTLAPSPLGIKPSALGEALTPVTRNNTPEVSVRAVDTPAVVDTPVKVPEAEAPVAPTVAEGVTDPTVNPVRETVEPTQVTEKITDLQDARAGKSQAEEAQINQQLQDLNPDTPAVKKKKIHPDDQAIMSDFIDYQRGIYKPDAKRAHELEVDASRIAEYYGLDMPKTTKGLADVFDQRLMEDGFGKKPKEVTGAALQAKLSRGEVDAAPTDKSAQPDWERQRQVGVRENNELASHLENGYRVRKHGGGEVGKTFAPEYRRNAQILENGDKNTAYHIDPKTGQVAEHPLSEILRAFSRSVGEDLPPLVIGNQPGKGGKRLDSTTAGATGTYNRGYKRIDFTEKRSVYHETVHHIDLAIKDYRGDNPKMRELQRLRKDITPQEVRRHQLQDSGVKNVEEYVAHAMDLLLDGRIKAGQLGNGVLKYMKAFFQDIREAFTSAAVYGRKDFNAVSYVKELDRVIHEIDSGLKMPKQKPLPKGATPIKIPTTEGGSVPPGMGGKGGTSTKGKKEPSPKELFAKRMMLKTGSITEVKERIAKAVNLEKEGTSEIDDILAESGLSEKQSNRIREIYNELESIYERNAKFQKQNRKNYVGNKEVDIEMNKQRNRDTRREGLLQRRLESELNRIARKGSMGERATQTLENITAGRMANMLTSTGNVSRNLVQEVGANIISTLKNPIKTVRSATQNGNLLKHEMGRSADGWKVAPTTVSEGYKYILGNTYKTLMTPVSAGQRARVGVMRTELTKWAAKQLEGRELTNAQAENLSRTLGNYTESMANTLAGVDNGMVSSHHAMKTLEAWKQFVKTGETADLLKFESLVERQATLASKMMRGVFEGETKKGRVVNALLSNVFPYVRTAWNLASTGTTRTLNPLSKSVIDSIRADQMSGGKNAMNILKNKIVDYGLLTGAAMLVNDNVIVYNDGDEVDQPQGISLRIPGTDNYIPVRATPIELPLAVTVAAARIAGDVANGEPRDPGYYGKIISKSLPYIDAFDQTTGAIESATNLSGKDGDRGYAAKAYGVNTTKSLVPFSNNGIEPQIDAIQGKSTDAKKVYDKNPAKWLGNTLNNSYFRGDYLPVSRDAAGRARTKDNQGIIINKTINDANTAEFNDRVSELVRYGRNNGLGKATQDMFNSYDTGKNNNFKSVQDTITFLDVPDGGAPDNAKKLEKNAKLTDLSQQIREGYFGDTGTELLTLDGENLKSDASVPNKAGTKNSKLPINMASIRNAIAQTDLGKEGGDALYAISQENSALYSRLKNKEISYDQYSAAKAELNQQEAQILSGSKNFQKLDAFMNELDQTGFFDADGLGSTKAGQTYLWNALNTMLASKGATPAAQYPEDDNGYKKWGSGGSGSPAINKPGDWGAKGLKWSPVGKRQMAATKTGKYTPVKFQVRLGNEVKKDRTQNYSDRSF